MAEQQYQWETVDDPLDRSVRIAKNILQMTTGHSAYQCKKIAYYAVATHFIPQFDPFPGLAIYGPPSTGKSTTLDILRELCLKPVSVTGTTVSEAALKACMAKANDATLIIEEADHLTDMDLEGILIIRYEKSTALAQKMILAGPGWWHLADRKTFGPTVLHRRNLFKDLALLRRVITTQTIHQKRIFETMNVCEGLFTQFKKINITDINIPTNLPKNTDESIAPGIFECYLPVYTLGMMNEDAGFLAGLVDEMKNVTIRLTEEAGYLEIPALLTILIALVDEVTGGEFTHKRINIEVKKLDPAAVMEYGPRNPVSMLSANQRNRILKEDLGFDIRSSHGRNRVYLTIPRLVEACDTHGVKDDLIDEWRQKIHG